MKNNGSTLITLCMTALIMVTSCSRDDVSSARPEFAVTANQPSFDRTAIILTEILLIAKENGWFAQSNPISDLMKPGRTLTADDIDAIEASLGIPYIKLSSLISELGDAANEYVKYLSELNLSKEQQSAMIKDAISTSIPPEILQGIRVDEQGRCILQDLCNVIGVFLVDVWFFFNCDFFCEEEVIPYYVLVQQLCEVFAC